MFRRIFSETPLGEFKDSNGSSQVFVISFFSFHDVGLSSDDLGKRFDIYSNVPSVRLRIVDYKNRTNGVSYNMDFFELLKFREFLDVMYKIVTGIVNSNSKSLSYDRALSMYKSLMGMGISFSKPGDTDKRFRFCIDEDYARKSEMILAKRTVNDIAVLKGVISKMVFCVEVVDSESKKVSRSKMSLMAISVLRPLREIVNQMVNNFTYYSISSSNACLMRESNRIGESVLDEIISLKEKIEEINNKINKGVESIESDSIDEYSKMFVRQMNDEFYKSSNEIVSKNDMKEEQKIYEEFNEESNVSDEGITNDSYELSEKDVDVFGNSGDIKESDDSYIEEIFFNDEENPSDILDYDVDTKKEEKKEEKKDISVAVLDDEDDFSEMGSDLALKVSGKNIEIKEDDKISKPNGRSSVVDIVDSKEKNVSPSVLSDLNVIEEVVDSVVEQYLNSAGDSVVFTKIFSPSLDDFLKEVWEIFNSDKGDKVFVLDWVFRKLGLKTLDLNEKRSLYKYLHQYSYTFTRVGLIYEPFFRYQRVDLELSDEIRENPIFRKLCIESVAFMLIFGNLYNVYKQAILSNATLNDERLKYALYPRMFFNILCDCVAQLPELSYETTKEKLYKVANEVYDFIKGFKKTLFYKLLKDRVEMLFGVEGSESLDNGTDLKSIFEFLREEIYSFVVVWNEDESGDVESFYKDFLDMCGGMTVEDVRKKIVGEYIKGFTRRLFLRRLKRIEENYCMDVRVHVFVRVFFKVAKDKHPELLERINEYMDDIMETVFTYDDLKEYLSRMVVRVFSDPLVDIMFKVKRIMDLIYRGKCGISALVEEVKKFEEDIKLTVNRVLYFSNI